VRATSLPLLAALLVGACFLDWPEPGTDDGDADGDVDSDTDSDVDSDGDGDVDADSDSDTDADTDGDVDDTVIPSVSPAPALDGNVSDWPALRFQLRFSSAADAVGTDPSPSDADCSVDFDLAWGASALYLGARVRDDEQGLDSDFVWQDDSLELYLSGDADGTAAYDANDHQFTMVRDGRIADLGTEFSPGSRGIELATRATGEGW
jgi:hypothetical protein